MAITKKDILESVADVREMRSSHKRWAIFFEKYPDKEREYVKIGKWDTAKVHREYMAKYDRILLMLYLLLKEEPNHVSR